LGIEPILIDVINILWLVGKKEVKKMDLGNLNPEGTGHKEKKEDDIDLL
jgi:hypothetical protein